MKLRAFLTWALALACGHAVQASALTCPEEFDSDLARLHSAQTQNPCQLFDDARAVLVVNTASHCGFTDQFAGLEALHQKYQDAGLVILGFPSNSFNQEEATEEGIANVCYKNYGVTFAMFTEVDVKGKAAHPIFAWLAGQTQKPSWNFNKYLLTDQQVSHFGSRTKPLESDLEQAIAKAVGR